METSRRTTFVGVSLTPDARGALQQAVLDLTTPTGMSLSMSTVLIHALRVAMRHKAELIDALIDSTKEGGS